MNVLILQDSTKNWVTPQLIFSIETVDGKILKSVNVGELPETVQPVWKQVGTYFTSPTDGSDVIIRLIDTQDDNSTFGGNDFAIDDITFRPCGSLVSVGFDTVGNTQSKGLCANNSATYTLRGSQLGYPNPTYQWQKNLNDGNGWVNIPGATDTVLTVNLNAPAAGNQDYRMGVLAGSSSSEACRIYSEKLRIEVNPYPIITMADNLSACAGNPLQLHTSQADSYRWTGPNGFTSIEQNPVLATSATPDYNGVYTVAVTSRGCSASASTTVTVYPQLIGAVSPNIIICKGDLAVLSASHSQGATVFKWAPSIGLGASEGASVDASPPNTTTYTVTIGNGACADITQSVKVTVLKRPAASAGPNKRVLEGDAVKLDGVATGDSVSYYWTPATGLDSVNSLHPKASPTENTTYTLHVTGKYCGDDTSSVFVKVDKKITVPNTFTPNNDGINDLWDIKQLNTYPDCSLLVFNRYGQQVYQSTGYAKPWDGLYEGKRLPVGTYYYIIDLKNGSPKIAGWVLRVR